MEPFIVGGAVLLVLGGGSVVLNREGRSWLRDHFPTEGRRREIAAAAEVLGLESIGGDTAPLDVGFPFLQRRPRTPLLTLAGKFIAILALTIWLIFAVLVLGLPFVIPDPTLRAMVFAGGTLSTAAIVFVFGGFASWLFGRRRAKDPQEDFIRRSARASGRPRFDRVFAGRWKDLDARVFDYSFPVGNYRQEWTCAVLPVDSGDSQLEVIRRGVLAQMIRIPARDRLGADDIELERAFRIHALPESDVQRLINVRVRSHLLEEAPGFRLAIQIRDKHLLYCGPRIPLDDRGSLLALAGNFRDALPRGT